MNVAQQLTKAASLAQANRLKNPHVYVRFPDDIREEFDVKPLSEDLRGLEVWITEGNGYIYGVVGDREDDGRKNIILPM